MSNKYKLLREVLEHLESFESGGGEDDLKAFSVTCEIRYVHRKKMRIRNYPGAKVSVATVLSRKSNFQFY
jgi:hypothetical protein